MNSSTPFTIACRTRLCKRFVPPGESASSSRQIPVLRSHRFPHKRADVPSHLPAVENQILDEVTLFLRNVFIHRSTPAFTILNHAGPARIIKEAGMHALTDGVVAFERKAQIAHAAHDMRVRQIL